MLLEDAVTKVEAEWGVKVIAIVTDASGESAKARREYAKLHPEIIVLDCYAHQVRLNYLIIYLSLLTPHIV
jgi:hypothetical protein